jgi:N-acetylglucosaminyldiphosphoundecaprenol N-acetyl-beta-D-mannosaminyltransferase
VIIEPANLTSPIHRRATSGPEIPRFDLVGIPVAAIDLPKACKLIAEAAASPLPAYVTVTGAHGILESVYGESVCHAHKEAFLVVPDGMPLVWLGRVLGCKSMRRVRGVDLMEAMFSRKEYRELRHYFYGSNASVIATLVNAIESRFGQFNFVGSYSPPMQPLGFSERDEVLSCIRGAAPDILWVGLSTPKQELWLQMHMKKIGCGVGIGVGAAFEFVSGILPQAPRWIQQCGFEWLFRLAVEPRRLFRRYFFVVPRFAWLFLRRVLTTQQSVVR